MLSTTKGIVAIFPVDYLSWTQNFSQLVRAANTDKRKVAGAAPIEIWITGIASKRTAASLNKLGWRLIENAGVRLDG